MSQGQIRTQAYSDFRKNQPATNLVPPQSSHWCPSALERVLRAANVRTGAVGCGFAKQRPRREVKDQVPF